MSDMKLAHPQLKFTHYDMNGADDVVKYGKWRQMARCVYLCVCAGVCVEYVDVDSDFVRARSDLSGTVSCSLKCSHVT